LITYGFMQCFKKQNVYLCYTYKSWQMYYHWWTVSIKPWLLFCLVGYVLHHCLVICFGTLGSYLVCCVQIPNTVPHIRNEASVVWHISFRIIWPFTHAGYAFFRLTFSQINLSDIGWSCDFLYCLHNICTLL